MNQDQVKTLTGVKQSFLVVLLLRHIKYEQLKCFFQITVLIWIILSYRDGFVQHWPVFNVFLPLLISLSQLALSQLKVEILFIFF